MHSKENVDQVSVFSLVLVLGIAVLFQVVARALLMLAFAHSSVTQLKSSDIYGK